MRLFKAMLIAAIFLIVLSAGVILLVLLLGFFGIWVLPIILFVFFTALAYQDQH